MQYVKKPKINKKCVECSADFLSSSPQKKFCSSDCQRKNFVKITGRKGTGLPTGTVGAISELKVATYLMRIGYSVFRALSPSCFCDLIAIKEKEYLLLEVRTGYLSVKGNLTYPKILHGKPTHYGIYMPMLDEVRLIKV